MNTAVSREEEARTARTAFWWVGVIVPTVILAVATIVIGVWTPGLPDPVAIHWGTRGVNGYGPAWIYVALCAGLGGGMVLLIAMLALFAHRMPQGSTTRPIPRWSPTTRLLGAMNLGLAGMVALLSLVGAGVQRGLADATQAPDVGGWSLLGFGLLVVLTALGWLLQPKVQVTAEPGTQARLRLAPGEQAAWFGTAAMGRPGVIGLSVAVLLLVITTVWTFALGGDSGWIMAVVTALVVILIATTLVFRVRINRHGLRVRSVAGWPRWNIAASEITDARTVDVNPMAEFGGWGVRIAVDGRMGVVLRTGEALQVTRKRGRTFIVTIDDARTAAAVLTAGMNNTDRLNDTDPSDRGDIS